MSKISADEVVAVVTVVVIVPVMVNICLVQKAVVILDPSLSYSINNISFLSTNPTSFPSLYLSSPFIV